MGLIGFQEASAIIGCTKRTLEQRYRDWKVPHYRIGKRLIRFSVPEIYGWVESRSHDGQTSGEE